MKNTIKKILNYGILTSLTYLFSEIGYKLYYGLVLNSYSQKQEDIEIDKLLKYKRNGTYVDIGANDPVRFNNTYRFYKKGWHGVNVEPNVNKYDQLRRVRPTDININCGISSKPGKLTFYNFYTDTLSTFSKKEADDYVAKGFDIESSKKVPTITMEQLFQENHLNNVDLLSIDTEGYDLIILNSNNWKKYRPKVICVESAVFGQEVDNKGKEIYKLLLNVGYKLILDNGLNSIYLDAQKRRTKD